MKCCKLFVDLSPIRHYLTAMTDFMDIAGLGQVADQYDALLVDIRTGYVVDTVYDIFW